MTGVQTCALPIWLNLALSQFDYEKAGLKKIITSDIEHNSPFLATIAFSNRTGLPREVIKRNDDGSINTNDYDFTQSVVVINCASNFDGRKLENIKEIVKVVHKAKGIIIIDAAQAMAHSSDILKGVEADAICFSAHKMYAPSLGVIVWQNSLQEKLDVGFIGGGMVDDVNKESYLLSAENKEHRYTRFESGLQAWGEIVALGTAIDWLNGQPKSTWQNLNNNTRELFSFLKSSNKAHLVNNEPNPTMSFYIDGIDSHLLGNALSRENIMARTGYFCAHYYLSHVLNLPPLIRFSLGLQNSGKDIEKIKKTLAKTLDLK